MLNTRFCGQDTYRVFVNSIERSELDLLSVLKYTYKALDTINVFRDSRKSLQFSFF